MAWIELHQTLPTHGKLLDFADALGLPEYAAVGLMSMLWLWSLDNAPEGRMPKSPRRIARALRWDGDAETLVSAMIEAGFLEADGDDLIIHNWHQYAGRLLDQRAKNAEKQRRHRERQGNVTEQNGCNDSPVETQPTLYNRNVTVTSPSHNPTTVPNRTVPDPTEQNHTLSEGLTLLGEDGGAGEGRRCASASDANHHADPSGEEVRPKGKAPTPRSKPYPDDFTVTDAMTEWAAEKAPAVNVAAQTEKFRNHHTAKRSLFVDWVSAWRTWMLNAQEYAERDGRANGGASAGMNAAPRFPGPARASPSRNGSASGPTMEDLVERNRQRRIAAGLATTENT